MDALKELSQIHLLHLLGIKLVGILIMIQVVVMVISMLLKVLTQVHGLAQGQHLIHVMMSLPVIRVLKAIVNTRIPVMTVMVTV